MKQFLQNKNMFDTTEATLVASWSNGRHFTEPEFIEENIYRSQDGKFYLVGNRNDGVASRSSATDRCRQLTTEEVLQWCRNRDLEFAVQLHLTETTISA